MKNLLLCLLFVQTLYAHYPADISYMVADLKYSKEHGVKLCEVQHGILSTFYGDIYLNGNNGILCPKIAEVFDEFDIKKWYVISQVSFKPLTDTFNESGWINQPSIPSLILDEEFKRIATIPPEDPSDINSYQAMFYVKANALKDLDHFRHVCPGILVIDAPTHRYWIDKYKVTRLFTGHPLLTKIKPEWGLYPKSYTETLAQQIIDDIPSDIYVIKPRSAFLGRGVILVAKEKLDSTLKYILTSSEALQKDTDAAYNHWNRDAHDSFLVEKYYPSDLIQVDEKEYEPTMRAAFVMIYNKNRIDVRFVGGYWMMPIKSVDQEGTLNELKKAYCKPPYFVPASAEELQEIGRQIEEALPFMYEKMLKQED